LDLADKSLTDEPRYPPPVNLKASMEEEFKERT